MRLQWSVHVELNHGIRPRGDLQEHVIIYQAPSGSGLLSPSRRSERGASAEYRESCGGSWLEEEPLHLKDMSTGGDGGY